MVPLSLPACAPRQGAQDERGDCDGQQCAADERGHQRQPLVADAAEVQHDADAGRHEQQRQVLQQVLRRVAQFRRRPAAQRQRSEQQRHADHRPRNRQREQLGEDFADQLKDEQQCEGAEHVGFSG